MPVKNYPTKYFFHFPLLIKLFLTLCIFVSGINNLSYAGQLKSDSLKQVLSSYPDKKSYSLTDTVKVNLLIELSRLLLNTAGTDEARIYAEEAVRLSQRINFVKGEINALDRLSMVHGYTGNFPEALKQYYTILQIHEKSGDQDAIAKAHSRLGLIYSMQQNYPDAHREFLIAHKMHLESGNKEEEGLTHANIAHAYKSEGKFELSINEYVAALEIFKKLKQPKFIAMMHGNLGHVYNSMGNYSQALKEQQISLKIKESLNDTYGISGSHNNIGMIYEKMGEYENALNEYEASLRYSETMNDRIGMAWSYVHIGNIKTALQHPEEGKQWITKGLQLFKTSGKVDGIMNAYQLLDKTDTLLGNYQDAYYAYREYILYRDSLDNEEIRKNSMKTKMQYEFDKKESLLQAASEAKIRRQKLIRNAVATGLGATLIFLIIVFIQRNSIAKARKQSEELLLNILPEKIADELKRDGRTVARQIDQVTVMFTDFKGFTQLTEKVSPSELVEEIDTCFRAFDQIMQENGVEKIKTIGDSYMCAGGLPIPNETHPFDVVRAAIEINSFMTKRGQYAKQNGGWTFDIRIGIHTGPVIAGIVGSKKYSYDIWGDTVNTASRMESSGESGKINISGTTHEKIHQQFKCIHRGKIAARNKGDIDMYFVESAL